MERLYYIDEKVKEAEAGFNISIESVLQRGFNHFRKAPGVFIIYTLIFLIALSNPLSGLVLGGPLLVGYYIGARYIQRGDEAGIELFFNSFQKFTPLFILNLLISLVILTGFLILIIPGVYFSVSYLFAYLFMWFYDVPPGKAIALSRKMVSGNFMQILQIWLILIGMNFLGALALVLGLLVTIPISVFVIYAIFEDIIGLPS